MIARQIITFLSDFGTRDGYVGAVKGVIKTLNPDIDIIDITHDIKTYDIRMAAYSILNYYNQFPKGTVHLAVVDPGVGSDRGIIVLVTKKHYFVGPDNGIFQFIAMRENHDAYKIDPKSIYDNKKGVTFHARDIFAPIAVKLTLGEHPENFGIPIEKLQSLMSKNKNTVKKSTSFQIDAITHDQFGNIIFDYTKRDMESNIGKKVEMISFKNFESNQIYDYYSQVAKGKPLFLWNSLEFLELAVNQDSAVLYFNFCESDRAKIKFK